MIPNPLFAGSSVALQRVRVRLARKAEAASLSHIQQIEVIRRALRESPWPVGKTNSKKPKVKASFGPAIAVGYESEAEYFDVELNARMDYKTAPQTFQEFLPPGMSVVQVKSIPRFFPSLEESINMVFYEIQSALLKETKAKWDEFWEKETFPVVKKKKDREEIIDARACVREWKLEGPHLSLQVRIAPKRTLKPERIIQGVLGLPDSDVVMGELNSKFQINRTRLCLEKSNGDLIDP